MPRRRIPVFLRAYQRRVPEGIPVSHTGGPPHPPRLPRVGLGARAGLNPAVLTAQVGRPDFPGVSAGDSRAFAVLDH